MAVAKGNRRKIDTLRDAIAAYLDLTGWDGIVRKRVSADRAALGQEYWRPAERGAFEALVLELAIKLAADGGMTPGRPGKAIRRTPCCVRFAADPRVPERHEAECWLAAPANQAQ